MAQQTISRIEAREILDSRGNPTVEVDLLTSSGHLGRAVLDEALRTEVDPILATVREERFLTALYAGDLLEVSTVMIALDDQLASGERNSWNARREYYRKNWADVVRYARDAAPEQGYLLAAAGSRHLGDAATTRAYADSALRTLDERLAEER